MYESYFKTHHILTAPPINWVERHSNPKDPKDRKNANYRLDYGLRS